MDQLKIEPKPARPVARSWSERVSHPLVSQDEIDALLEGFSVERLASGPPLPGLARDGSSGYRADLPQDLEHVTSDALPGLDAIHRAFALGLSARLSSLMRRTTRVLAEPVATQDCEVLLGALGGQVKIHFLNLHRPFGSCMMVLQTAWMCSYVDLLFGGNGNAGSNQGSDLLSATEAQAERRLLALMCQEYMLAWRARFALQLVWRRSESSTAAVLEAARGDALVVGALNLQAGDVSGKAWIIFPQATLAPLAEVLAAPRSSGPWLTASTWSWRQGSEGASRRIVPADDSAGASDQPTRAMVLHAGEVIELGAGDLLLRSSAAALDPANLNALSSQPPRVTRPRWAAS